MDGYRFHPITRQWVSKDSDKRSCYLTVDGRVSLAVLLNYLDEAAHESVQPEDIMLNFTTARWEEPSTAAERAERAERIRQSDEKREAWEWKTYQELKKKFEGNEE